MHTKVLPNFLGLEKAGGSLQQQAYPKPRKGGVSYDNSSAAHYLPHRQKLISLPADLRRSVITCITG